MRDEMDPRLIGVLLFAAPLIGVAIGSLIGASQ